MGSFLVLLRKELRELLTPQMVLPFIIAIAMFAVIGKVASSQTEKAAQPQPVTVLDLDETPRSTALIASLPSQLFAVHTATGTTAQALLDQADPPRAILTIPRGFADTLSEGTPLTLPTYTRIQSFSFASTQGSNTLASAVQVINEQLSNELIASASDKPVEPTFLKQPVRAQETIVIGDRQASGSSAAVIGFISQQTYFIPIILFLIILIAAQMVATSVATEKENKTLETLLSLPIRRQSIVTAKLLASGLAAALFAGAYLVGFRGYMGGVTGASGDAVKVATASTVQALGLTFTTGHYLLLGISLFFGILTALAIALVLGALAEDVKGVQSATTPLMILITVPYFLTTMVDLHSLPTAVQWLIYAIPFSHPFLAIQSLLLHNYLAVAIGILYQILACIVAVAFATRLFASDRILSIRWSWGKRGNRTV